MATLSDERIAAVESFVTEWIHDEPVPGLGLALFDADGELYAEGFGTRDLESNAPVSPDTLSGMGSISKAVTALAVLQLAEDGALSLDDPVDEYVDHLSAAPGDPITVAELLSHTSGLPAADVGAIDQHLNGVPAAIAGEADWKRFLRATADLRDVEGERFMYNNGCYGVLGAVIEAVDGRDYVTYVDEAVLSPLGMSRSGFGRDAVADEDDAMTPYRPGADAPEPVELPLDPLMFPAGGLVSSPREMVPFLRAMMTDGAVDGTRLCPPETVERLQRGRAVRDSLLDGTEMTYGYGWMRQPLADDELVGHGGSVLVATAYAGFLAEAGLGIVLTCNTTASPGPMALAAAILAVATGREPTVVPTYALRESAEAVAGTYEDFRGRLTATIEPDGGGLSMSLDGPFTDEEVPLFPESLDPEDHRFYTVAGGGARVPVEFDLGGDRADLFYRRVRLRRTDPGG